VFGLDKLDGPLRNMLLDFKIKVALASSLRKCEQSVLERGYQPYCQLVQHLIEWTANETFSEENELIKKGLSPNSAVFGRVSAIDSLLAKML